MAEKLKKYYEIIAEKAGMQARMRLAMKTGISSPKAVDAPDTPENLEKFHKAVVELLGEDVPKL